MSGAVWEKMKWRKRRYPIWRFEVEILSKVNWDLAITIVMGIGLVQLAIQLLIARREIR